MLICGESEGIYRETRKSGHVPGGAVLMLNVSFSEQTRRSVARLVCGTRFRLLIILRSFDMKVSYILQSKKCLCVFPLVLGVSITENPSGEQRKEMWPKKRFFWALWACNSHRKHVRVGIYIDHVCIL